MYESLLVYSQASLCVWRRCAEYQQRPTSCDDTPLFRVASSLARLTTSSFSRYLGISGEFKVDNKSCYLFLFLFLSLCCSLVSTTVDYFLIQYPNVSLAKSQDDRLFRPEINHFSLQIGQVISVKLYKALCE